MSSKSFGAAFFGWLTATGTAVLLTALLAAGGADSDPGGLGGASTLLVIVFVAYCCGGCIASLVARGNGLRQGLGVWSWAVVVTGVGAVLSVVAGARSNLLATLGTFAHVPIDEALWSTEAMVTAPAFAVVSLVGAILGGLTGIAFRRRADRSAGVEAVSRAAPGPTPP